MQDNRRPYIYFPIFFAVALVIGLVLGSKLYLPQSQMGSADFNFPTQRFNKINEVLNYIEHEYVDSVDRHELTEDAIQILLQELDPHSYYIPAQDLQAVNEPLQGKFSGIGVQFSIQKDTVVVITPVEGGPSSKLGIAAGDRIVEVEGENIAGVGITNSAVMDKLRGEKGTEVRIEVFRKGEKRTLPFTINRDDIPIYSVDASYMIRPKIGYIKLSRFSRTTHEEFVQASAELKDSGMEKLVLDLRGNGGGFLDAATALADEFLPEGKMLVYTMGKARKRRDYHSTSTGSLQNTDLIVLLDEGSASASEIIAGAIQDNDRGGIIGRKSFGKGLVQEQSDWPDGSAIRLTIARYYTPTGRCIQKPYGGGTKQYYLDRYQEYLDGESFNVDSIDFPDSLKFITPGGKTVYGGGGIMPDIFVPLDTTLVSPWFNQLRYRGLIRQFTYEYVDEQRATLNAFEGFDAFNRAFKVTDQLLERFIAYAEEQGVERNNEEIAKSNQLIRNRLKGNIARNVWDNRGFFPIYHELDRAVQRALQEFGEPRTLAQKKGEPTQ